MLLIRNWEDMLKRGVGAFRRNGLETLQFGLAQQLLLDGLGEGSAGELETVVIGREVESQQLIGGELVGLDALEKEEELVSQKRQRLHPGQRLLKRPSKLHR